MSEGANSVTASGDAAQTGVTPTDTLSTEVTDLKASSQESSDSSVVEKTETVTGTSAVNLEEVRSGTIATTTGSEHKDQPVADVTSKESEAATANQPDTSTGPESKAEPVTDTKPVPMDTATATCNASDAPTPPRAFDIGTVSTYVYESNDPCEDRHYISPDKQLLGVFDGHGGSAIAEYVSNNIGSVFNEERLKTADVQTALTNTFARLEDVVLQRAREGENIECGSCGVVVCIDKEQQPHVTVANVGDSKAVLGCKFNNKSQHIAVTVEHNVRITTEALALQTAFPKEKDVVSFARDDDATPRVKGTLQLTRCFGDAFLKVPSLFPENDTPQPAKKKRRTSKTKVSLSHAPYVTAEPGFDTDELEDVDFVIVASDGLWDHINEDMAVACVYEFIEGGGKRDDVSKYLVDRMLERVAFTTYGGLTLEGLRDLPLGQRRHFHDDTTVIVAFFDPK